HADLFDKYSELSGKVDTLLDHLHLRSPAREHHGSSSHFHQRNSVKLDVPRFDGRDPMGWIFKISQLFEYQNTPEEERITVAFFYLDGAALSWYQWMFRNGFITSWSGFLQALESRFAPSYYDDPKGALFKLTQRGTDIRREVLALQPISLPQAMALAKLQEDKIRDRRQAPPRNHNTPSASYAPPTRKPHSTYVQRTPDEMALRREKGLCYNCEEKWSSTHRCKGRVLLFIADNPSPTSDEPISEPPLLPLPEPTPACPPDLDSTSELTPPHVSLHALSGLPSSETFRLVGIINHSPLTILIDSGSTHNFLQPRLAQFLRLKTQPTNPLNVLVGNGSVLKCDQVCHDISLLLQDHHFLQPSSLPPPRSIVHRITLLPNTAPINVRPYRYPQFQKSEIEKQVSELLESGLIQPSMTTVRDRFPFPTIDELLDELGSANWFSKLDLRQGFHQILMHGPDVEKTAFRTH
ncbi:Retrovirus-related Pol polyprotein from transposon opus, partial [Glycine soja]